MNLILIAAFLFQSLTLPPRVSMENPASISPIPQKLRKDYDKLWSRFVAGREDAKVLNDLNKLLKKQKDLTAAMIVSAYIDMHAGKDSSAIPRFRQVLTINPKDKIALYYLGEFAFAGRDYTGAADYYSKLLAVDAGRYEIEAKRQKAILLSAENLLQDASHAE